MSHLCCGFPRHSRFDSGWIQTTPNSQANLLTTTSSDWAPLKGDPLGFLPSIVAKHQKIEGGPFGEKNPKKVSQRQKKTG